MREVGEILLFITVLVLLVIGGAFVGYHLYDYFGPKYEETRHKIFEQSKTFHDGSIRTIRDLQVRWNATKEVEARAAIKAAVFHELNSFNEDKLPSDLKRFVDELRVNP